MNSFVFGLSILRDPLLEWVNATSQFTSYAVVSDFKNRIYYFRTYDNYDISKLDLSKIDFAKSEFKIAPPFGRESYQAFQVE